MVTEVRKASQICDLVWRIMGSDISITVMWWMVIMVAIMTSMIWIHWDIIQIIRSASTSAIIISYTVILFPILAWISLEMIQSLSVEASIKQ